MMVLINEKEKCLEVSYLEWRMALGISTIHGMKTIVLDNRVKVDSNKNSPYLNQPFIVLKKTQIDAISTHLSKALVSRGKWKERFDAFYGTMWMRDYVSKFGSEKIESICRFLNEAKQIKIVG